MTEIDIKTRVQNGIELLNKARGPEWVDQIDVDSLDVMFGTKCVLGQLYGWYWDGLKSLGITDEGAIEYGFQISGLYEDDEDVRHAEYVDLTVEWADQITALQAA